MPQLEISTFISQIFWLLVTFSGLYLIMWKIALPNIANVLEARQKRIEDNLERAEQAKLEAEKTFSSYEESIRKAREEAQDVQAKSSKKLSDEIDSKEALITEELNKKIHESDMEIQKTVDNVIDDIHKSATDVASDAILRLTGSKPDGKNLNRAVERILEINN